MSLLYKKIHRDIEDNGDRIYRTILNSMQLLPVADILEIVKRQMK